jgi:uncharacterized protein YjbI with pentapeptide repeats
VPALPAGLAPLDVVVLRSRPEHCEVELVDIDVSAEELIQLSLESARVKGCCFEGAELRRLRCARVVFENCDFANTRWFDCELDEVAFLDCRFIGASITGGGLSAVLLRDCLAQMAKLSHLGRPHARLERCDLRGALLMESDLGDVRFADCDLGGLELFNASLVGSDLRDNELEGLKGAACLRGATIDALQLLALAPALAAHVGLVVEQADVEGA